MDVADPAQVTAAVDQAVGALAGIDVLVDNAGRGLLGAVEAASAAEIESLFATNLLGLLATTRAVLPVMRRQQSGRIINISSLGGFRAAAGWGLYNASRFAVEAVSEAMAQELAPLGISVIVVEPGLFRTDFLDRSSLHRTALVLDDYAATVGATRRRADALNHAQTGDPDRAAAALYTVATVAAPPLRLQLGADAVAAVEARVVRVMRARGVAALALSTSYSDGAESPAQVIPSAAGRSR